MSKSRSHNDPIDEMLGSMTVMVFQLKGNNATLQQGLKFAEGAFQKLSMGNAPRINSLPPTSNGDVPPAGLEDESVVIEGESGDQLVNEPASQPRERPKRTRKPSKIPDILPDFDPNASSPTLKEYVATKATDSNQKKYLAVCAFFRECRDTKSVGTQHIFTCFKLLGWTVPNDLDKPLANLAQNKRLDRSGGGLYAINMLGLNDIAAKAE